ncbi:hypothetical protein Tco_0761946 [Tanacetum coccineum]
MAILNLITNSQCLSNKFMQALDQNVEEEVKDAGFVAMEEIKFIKSYQAATISGLLFIHQSSSYDQDKDVEEGDASESLSGLRSMPDDDLASIFGFERQDSADHVSKEGTDTLHAFANKSAQSDPLGYLHAELGILNTKIDRLERNISEKVAEAIKSSIPAIVEAQVQKNLHNQLPNILLKPMYKEFNAFNKLESQRFVLLQKELSKFLHKRIRKSIRLRVCSGMKEVRHKLFAYTSTVATNSQHVQDLREKNSEGTVSMEDDSDEDDLDKQPLSKRFKNMTPIPNPIPPNTFVPEHLLKPEEQQKSLHEFTDQLFGTTSSNFSPTPPREPIPPRDPAKGKEVAIVKEQVNELVTYQEEGGSILEMPKIKSFITLEGTLSQEEFNNQIKELKRISDLKAEKEKSEQELRKMFNQATLKAQTQKWTEHEAKKAKIIKEYNHQISFRADQLPIKKISYVVNPNKEAIMKIKEATIL